MLGNGARFLGPSAAGNNAGSINNQQHQSQFSRGVWPTATTFQGNATEYTVPITDSSFFTQGFVPSQNTNSPFIPTLPFELVKNWNSGALAFSQANSSIFVQSHTADFINCTTSASVTTSAPKTVDSSFGRWETGSLIEPLQIHLPSTNFSSSTAIKTEKVHSGSSSSSTSSTSRKLSTRNRRLSKAAKGNKNINDCILNLHQQHQSKSTPSETKVESNGNGCSRTLPLTWNQALQQLQNNVNTSCANSYGNCTSADTTTHTTATLLQIKREPCQVSEVTTSNNLLTSASFSGTPAIIKIEQKSPTTTSSSTLACISSSMDSNNGGQQNNAGVSIPIGIAVGRQRLQETTDHSIPQLQSKDLNRFSLGLADLGCSGSLSQNMFFAGTTNIPLNDVMTQNRTPPTLFQYPTMPMEIPSLPAPVGYQLVRDPSTGQFLFLPTATTIEPMSQALIWPTYQQATSHSSMQPPHMLLPPLQQSLQPPPLALLGSDYLTASTTLHQSHMQHTSTHSTRLVALTSSDTKRTKCTQHTTNVPVPIPAQTLIKIEDGSNAHHRRNHHQNHHHLMYEHEKSMMQTSVQTPSDMTGQLYYQHPGLIQIAPQPAHQSSSVPTVMELAEVRQHQVSPPPLQLTTSSHSMNSLNDTCNQISYNIVPPSCPPEVQDANIQTSPVMSEDDNTSGHDDILESNTTEYEEESQDNHQDHQQVEKPTLLEPKINTEEMVKHLESLPDTSVTSSSLVLIKKQVELPDTSVHDSRDGKNSIEPIQSEEQREPVDLSGLQLLSNSIDVFQKKIIKQEPQERLLISSPSIISTSMTPSMIQNTNEDKKIHNEPISLPTISKGISEDLGGLNLLCALAEQRLEEDFHNNEPPLLHDDNELQIKKRKHKVKSSKKSKHKDEKKAKKRKHSTTEEHDEDLKDEIAASLRRVKTKFENLPLASVDDVCRLMENDMKEKLANITRQLEEKRRELKQIVTTPDTNEKECSSSWSSGEQSKPVKNESLRINIIPALSPSFSSSSNSESLVEIPKLSSDTDTGSKDDCEGSNKSKRKFSIPFKNIGEKQETETIVSKKSKSYAEYILATKNRIQSMTSPTIGSWTSSIRKNGKASLPFVKQEDQEGRGILKESAFKDDRVFSIFGDGNHQKFQASSPMTLPSSSRLQQPNVKHHSKHKKHKERRRQRERQRMDTRCMITSEHLKQSKNRVLMVQGGLFYAGSLSPVEQNEIFAIALDGERGNRPHIMPREEILKQAILEIQPKSVSDCPPGTRVCAYWSQQYRCLYPGVATAPSSPDSDIDEKYINVEFDDGDNGRISLDHIRFLLSDYPLVEYDPNPLQSLNKRKRPLSQGGPSDHEKTITLNTTDSVTMKSKERKRLKKIRKDKMRFQSSPDPAQDVSIADILERKHKKKHKCQDDLCKHRKHKKKRKHKKHHHRELDEEDRDLQNQVQSAMSISNDSNNNEEEFDDNDSVSLNESVTQYEIVKKVHEEMMIKDDPDTMESSVTESSGSVYQPKKTTLSEKPNRSNESGSKIAAFLPARQLWAWCGKGFKRSAGRVKKQFYRSIQRGKETISVGDSAVFLSTGRPDRPYIGHIESMWETANGGMVVRVKWFYHPEETQGCHNLKYPGALFESPHEDENDVQTISHKCEVLDFDAYSKKYGDNPKHYESIYDNNDTYYLAGHYDPTIYHIKMQSEIPILPENQKWVTFK